MAPIVKMVTATGREHGLINRVANSVPDNGFKYMTPENKAKAEKQKKEDSKIVRARYLNNQDKINGELEMPYCKYAGDTIDTYRFISGQEYDVPMGLVNQVNSATLPTRSQKVGEDGKASEKDGAPIRVHEFFATRF